MPRLDRRVVLVALAIAAFALFAWQGITTAGRTGPLDAAEYLVNAQYLDAKGWLPPAAVSYEYSAPPLFEALAVGAERVVGSLPSLPLELPWNLATRLLWLALVVGSALCLTAASRRIRWAGAAGLALAALWGLDEAIQLGKAEQWSSGQLISLGAALGLVAASGLIAREIWPGHPGRALATAGFVLAYPVVLRLGALFHPETTMAFLSALVVWLVIRAERREWPLRLGLATGILCGLDLLTRQSAVVVFACALATALWVGRGQALRFGLAAVGAVVLVAGPWLGYAAYTWGNPLQGNLQRPNGGGMLHGEPLSFYTSTFPVRSLVVHPYREWFANQLLPQMHADLWSDWFGAFHQPAWGHPSHLDRLTASSQSVLGLVGDALAIGGLVAFGVPMLVRVLRRRPTGPAGVAYAFLALLTLVGFAAFVAQIVRYPQYGGKEIKASYLLFAAPAFAVFSVASWVALAHRRRWAGVALGVVAALYLISYPVSLASALSRSYDPHPTLVPNFGYVDLTVAVPPLTGSAGVGAEKDFTVWVANAGTETAFSVTLTLRLASGMRLLGPPAFERGSGCTGSQTVVCNLDFLEPGMSTPIRFGVILTKPGVQTLVATATSQAVDAHPADNSGSVTFEVS
jgi:4-amino-4-deoxy-L-arabinose transferase-like glycosyltransferase